MPKVTIAIPTYNRVVFLSQALDSAIAQTYSNIEVVVSNNASTDQTENLLSTYSDERLIVIHQTSNIGMMGNWDACLAVATGDFFLLLSDDDVLEKNAISELVAEFLNEKFSGLSDSGGFSINEQIGMVWCRAKVINEKNELLRYSANAPEEEDTFSVISGFFSSKRETFPCCILLRTSDIRRLGGYASSQLTLIADAYVWMGCCLGRKKVRFVQTCLTNYRVHTSNVTGGVTIDEWLHKNSELARFCINYYKVTGDHARALLIDKLIIQFNAKVAISLIAVKLRNRELTPLHAISQYFNHCENHHINYRVWRLLKEIILKLNRLLRVSRI